MKVHRPQPPLPLEQWLSLVTALPSHRSRNEGHRAFGATLIQMVYEKLPQQHDQDPTARDYLTQMLAEVAWAVRGFSVIRDHFEYRVQANSDQLAASRDRAKSWLQLSPLHTGSIASKVVLGLFSLLLAAGGAAALVALAPGTKPLWIACTGALLAVLAHLILDIVTASRIRCAIAAQPDENLKTWSNETRVQYESVARGFLEKAFVIEQRFYPVTSGEGGAENTDDGTKPDCEAMIRRALSFG